MSTNPNYSQLRSAARVSLRDAVPLRAPFTLFVEPTNICNFKCVYCPESFSDFEEKSGGLSRMDIASFERLADQVVAMGGVKTLNFYMMGEPFVNKATPEFVRVAKERRIADRVIVTSNGSLLTPDVSRRVLEAGLDYLRISIYGGASEPFARKTQSRIPLERVRQNVARFRQMRDEAGARTFLYVKMIDSGDPSENQSFKDMFAPLADEVMLEPAMNWNDPDEGNLAQMDRESLLKSDYFAAKKNVCPFPFYTLVVHADLRVGVCCVDWAKETAVGDLKTQTLAEIWRGQALRDFQTAHLDGRRNELSACESCTFLHTAPDNLDGLSSAEFLARREAAPLIAAE